MSEPRTKLSELREKLSGMDDISGVVLGQKTLSISDEGCGMWSFPNKPATSSSKSVVFDDDGYCQSHIAPSKGYWRTDGETYTCTFCGFKLDELWDYCPACVDE